jgi:hypothetical protein
MVVDGKDAGCAVATGREVVGVGSRDLAELLLHLGRCGVPLDKDLLAARGAA